MSESLTRAEWDQVKERLMALRCPVDLQCDGYRVTLALSRISQFKNAILVYVNGEFKGKWLVHKDCEEARRFFPLRKKFIYSLAQRDRMVRHLGKRRAREMGADDKSEIRGAYWTSFASLKHHLIANNESIKLIHDE